MNTPWKITEPASSALAVTGGNPAPVTGFSAVSAAVDVRGYTWVEFTVALSNNIGGDPATQIQVQVEYSDTSGPLAGQWFPLTVEDVDTSGNATQAAYTPVYTVSGTSVSARVGSPPRGTSMRCRAQVNGTPDASSTLSMYVARRGV